VVEVLVAKIQLPAQRDCGAVYYHDQMFGRATSLREADPVTFVSLRNDFGYDSKSVWFRKQDSQWRQRPSGTTLRTQVPYANDHYAGAP